MRREPPAAAARFARSPAANMSRRTHAGAPGSSGARRDSRSPARNCQRSSRAQDCQRRRGPRSTGSPSAHRTAGQRIRTVHRSPRSSIGRRSRIACAWIAIGRCVRVSSARSTVSNANLRSRSARIAEVRRANSVKQQQQLREMIHRQQAPERPARSSNRASGRRASAKSNGRVSSSRASSSRAEQPRPSSRAQSDRKPSGASFRASETSGVEIRAAGKIREPI